MVHCKLNIDALNCLCCINSASPNITYILYPMDILDDWIEPAASKYNTTIVVITGMDWDNDLTPWSARGVPKGTPNFQGNAQAFMKKMNDLVAAIEQRYNTSPSIERTLVGVSLSGLYTLWQWSECNLFDNIASLSGSFWYEGFMAWFVQQNFKSKKGKAYFLLGKQESHSRVKAFDSVEINTQRIVAALQSQDVRTKFDMVPGNHYQYPIPRLNRVMESLFGQM